MRGRFLSLCGSGTTGGCSVLLLPSWGLENEWGLLGSLGRERCVAVVWPLSYSSWFRIEKEEEKWRKREDELLLLQRLFQGEKRSSTKPIFFLTSLTTEGVSCLVLPEECLGMFGGIMSPQCTPSVLAPWLCRREFHSVNARYAELVGLRARERLPALS